jgi:glutathione S-transferase
MTIEVSAFNWVPPFAQGLVRDLRVRWALEEARNGPLQVYLSEHPYAGVEREPSLNALSPVATAPVLLVVALYLAVRLVRTRRSRTPV